MPESPRPSRFRRAERRAVNLRMALDGPTGAGKTLTALLLARGIVGPAGAIAVIDTEHGTAEKFYADRVEFDTLVLTEFRPEAYIAAIADAAAEGYPCLVIDSLSHAWEGVLAMVDARGGEFGAWRHVTPHHNALVQALLTFPGHLIVTMRSKMAYEVTKNADGKTAVSKLGLQPVQRAGLEYEFDVVADVDLAHQLAVSKSRVPRLADRVVPFAGEEFGREIAEAISEGKPDVSARMARLEFVAGVGKRALVEALRASGVPSSEALADADLWHKAQRVAQALRLGTPIGPDPAPADPADGAGEGPSEPQDGEGGAPAAPETPPPANGPENGAQPPAEPSPADDAAADAAAAVAFGDGAAEPAPAEPAAEAPPAPATPITEVAPTMLDPADRSPRRELPEPAAPNSARGRMALIRMRGLEASGLAGEELTALLDAEGIDSPYLLGDDDLYHRLSALVRQRVERQPAKR